MAVNISIQVPDSFAERLGERWQDVPRHTLEALVADACRHGLLTTAEVQEVLGFDSRFEVDEFLKRTGVLLEYTREDLHRDLETFDRLSRQ